MDKETLRMQMLSGVITESEYKAKLEENSTKESLNENFVGMGMVGNIFDREKTDYELAFEHFTKGTSLNENEGMEVKGEIDNVIDFLEGIWKAGRAGNNIDLANSAKSLLDYISGNSPFPLFNPKEDLEEATSPESHKKNLTQLIATGERQLADLNQMKDKISDSSITKAKEAIDLLKSALKDLNK